MMRGGTVCRMAGLTAVALALAGCGGGSGSAAPTTTIAKKLSSKEVFDIARPSTVELQAKQGELDVGGSG